MVNMDEVAKELVDFYDELPTLACGEGGCGNCSARFAFSCAPLVPGERAKERAAAWDEDTVPEAPAFLKGFDDDYIVDVDTDELGGEG